jgi:hypothetical protein
LSISLLSALYLKLHYAAQNYFHNFVLPLSVGSKAALPL